ncbi:MAG: DUF1236 domain-containing protein [Bauldia sp.]|nr:DUF1236 domain-containing protein [Bauldia sp.]MCW5716522.1 DUF1236 domain-containing protein [Bauldia sp.]
MRILPKVAAATLLAAVSFPTISVAQSVTATATVVVDLNLRAGPGPAYPVITTIPANAAVNIYGCDAALAWCDIDWNGNRGWSYSAYLIYGGTVTAPLPAPVPLPQVVQNPPPTVVYDPEAYFNQYYQNQEFYNDRARIFGAAGGIGAGATIGALIAGPIGAAVGAAIGAAVGVNVIPPQTVVTYIQQQQPQPVYLAGEVVVGAGVPADLTLYPVPNYEYPYAYINGQLVLVDPSTRVIVYVFR